MSDISESFITDKKMGDDNTNIFNTNVSKKSYKFNNSVSIIHNKSYHKFNNSVPIIHKKSYHSINKKNF